jgi:DNA-binding transcriptional LysR family regulator
VLLDTPPGAQLASRRDARKKPDNESRTVELASRLPLSIFAAPQHPLVRMKRRGAIPRHELAEYQVFVTDGAGDYYDVIRGYLKSDALPGPAVQAAGSIGAVKRAVVDDAGAIGVLPEYAVADDFRERHLARIVVSPEPPCLRLVALVPPRQAALHPAVADMLDQLRALGAELSRD